MGSTYLQLTNRVIRRIGEVELNENNFADVRGVQALCKDAVQDAVNRINAQKWEWPFNAYEHQMTLGVGLEEYAWPDNFKKVDWNSFQIQKSTDLNVRSRHLIFKNKDEWYSLWKDRDDDSGNEGLDIPLYVTESHGGGFVVTPTPDKGYALRYKYWITPPQMEVYDDTTTIPVQLEYVIIDAALYIMNMYREADNTLGVVDKDIEDGITAMANLLLTNYEHMYDTRTPRANRSHLSG